MEEHDQDEDREHDHDDDRDHDDDHDHDDEVEQNRGYEFGASENAELVRLVDLMRFVGKAQAVLGLLLGAAAIWLLVGRSWGLGLLVASQALFNLLAGQWELASAASFRKVVDTKGHDVSHLMAALAELRKMFALQKSLMLGVIGMVVVSGLLYVLTGPGGEGTTDGAQGAPPASSGVY